GDLPLGICAEDDSRQTIGLQYEHDDRNPHTHAQGWIDHLRDDMPDSYTPFGFWDDQKVYIETAVEKLDLRNLFESVCAEFHVPITNLKGWSDLNARAAMMKAVRRARARRPPMRAAVVQRSRSGRLLISESMRENLDDLSNAVGWSPDGLIVERFGLNADIRKYGKHKVEANALVVLP